MKLAPRGFVNPFKVNHCAVLAFACLGPDRSTQGALDIAREARRAGLLDADGTARRLFETIDRWGPITGLRVVETWIAPGVRFAGRTGLVSDRAIPRPTLAIFRRFVAPRGRWIVMTNGHVQAILNGKILGWHGTRSRVVMAWRVEDNSHTLQEVK